MESTKNKNRCNNIFKNIVCIFEEKYGKVNLSDEYKQYNEFVVCFDSKTTNNRILIQKHYDKKSKEYSVSILYINQTLFKTKNKIYDNI